MTSRIEGESVRSITRRSMPMPSPAVGGMPCYRAVTKSSSRAWGISSSPAAWAASWASKRCRWSTGSLSSEKALAISRPAMNSSNRSTTSGSALAFPGQGRGLQGVAQDKGGLLEAGLHLEVEEFRQGPAVAFAGTQADPFLQGQLHQGLAVPDHLRRGCRRLR